MKRTLLVVLIALTLCAPQANGLSPKFTSDKYPITMSFPAGWSISFRDEPMDEEHEALHGVSKGDHWIMLSVFDLYQKRIDSGELSEAETSRHDLDLTKASLEEAKKMAEDIATAFMEKTTHYQPLSYGVYVAQGSRKFIYLDAISILSGEKVRQYSTIFDGYQYIIEYGAGVSDQFDSELNTVEKALASVSFGDYVFSLYNFIKYTCLLLGIAGTVYSRRKIKQINMSRAMNQDNPPK